MLCKLRYMLQFEGTFDEKVLELTRYLLKLSNQEVYYAGKK